MTVSESVPTRPFGAVGTAMVTPFTPDGSAIDYEAAAALAAHLVATGNDQLVVSGTTGESPTTAVAEKVELARVVREAAPGATVIAGVGSNDTAHSVEMARAHADLGLDGLLVVSPYYSRPSQAGIEAHVRAVLDATELPVMLYDIPGRTGVPFARDTLLRLGEHEQVLAVKDAKGDLAEATGVMAATGLAYYSGEDALNLPWLSIGAAGVVSVVGQVAGPLERELVDAVDRGDLAAARSAHTRLAPLVEALMSRMPGAVAAKAALHLQGVLPHAAMRGPLLPADPDQLRGLAAVLETVDGIPTLDTTRRSA